MIGNDIVDLKQAAKDSNWKRPRFLDKVFTTTEQQLISNSKNQNETVWLLWSMKEAAYKIYVRQFGKRFFNPKRLVCELISKTNGIVTIEDEFYQTTSHIKKESIHTIANTLKAKGVKTEYFRTESSSCELQSKLSREAVLETYSKIKKIPKSSITIQKDVLGIPYFFQNHKKQKETLSMSHHGYYCAYAIL